VVRHETRVRPKSWVLAGAVALLGLQLIVLAFHQGGLYQRAVLFSQVDGALLEHTASMEVLRNEQQTHTNALAQQVARLQAHITRLDALGLVLSDLAQVDYESNFDFDSQPGLGGRMPVGSPEVSSRELTASIAKLQHQVEDNQLRLEILRGMIQNRRVVQEMRPSSWPVRGGWVSSYYGFRKDPFHGRQAFHHGIDIVSANRSRIFAAAPGVVEFSGRKGNYGLMVQIAHGDGYTTRYAHASTVLVQQGEYVTRGQEIASVGSTGRSTGAHLHFEVLKNGETVNPLNFLSARR